MQHSRTHNREKERRQERACQEVADGEEKEMNLGSIFSLSPLFTQGRERTERERKEKSKRFKVV